MERYKMVLPSWVVIGMRYDPVKKKLIIGGKASDGEIIRTIITSYFKDLKAFRWKVVNKYKVKFDISNLSVEAFSNAVKELRRDSVVVEQVKSLGRIFR